jgi:magnesium-transporting ATPase (P-type)
MPQFLFLSSYVNNDVIAVAASSMMVYAWVISLTDGWNIKNSILLALGIIICALSYYDAYAWILMSIVFFVFSFIKIKVIDKSKEEEEKEDKKGKKIEFNYKDMFKYGIIISIIVLVGISYFFIRSIIVNHGDMLGIKSFLSACEEGGADFIKPSNRDTAKNLNMTYLEMLKSTRWIGMTWMEATFKSFVCYIGAMQYQSDNWIYIFYKVLFIVGLVGMLLAFIFNTKKNAKMKIFYLSLLVSAIVPVLLSIQYSYATDYQSQGRYVYPMWMSLIIFTTTGIEFLLSVILKFIKNEKVKNIIKILVYAILSIIIIYILLVKANSLFMETIKL